MNPIEEMAKLAKTSQEMCGKEIQQVLRKYNCTMHVQETTIDGKVVERNFFFNFNPQAFQNQPNAVPDGG